MIVITILSFACTIILVIRHLNDDFKIGYYEQTLKNNKHLFSNERFGHIEGVMSGKVNWRS